MLKAAIFISLAAVVLAAADCRRGPDSPLTTTAANGDVRAIRSLLNQGIDPNRKDSGGYTALMWAARFGNIQVMDTLLNSGADPNLLDGHNRWNALIHAIHKGEDKAAVLLMNSGANINTRAGRG